MSDADLAALQTTLAGEHAALYVYGVLGGRTSRSAARALYDTLVTGYDLHRWRRDELTRRVSDAGGTPVAAAVTYDVPRVLDTPARISAVALGVERRCASTYAAMVAGTSAAHRPWAITALTQTAVRELALGGRPEAFPGADELPER